MAFLADVSLILFVGLFAVLLGRLTGRPGLVFTALFVLWLYYLSVSIWLTEGETAGKAACALQLRRSDGSRPRRSARSFLWSIGRHSIGYLIADVLGMGVLLAAFTPRRRCLHDLAFGSLVVQTQEVVVPKGFWSRYDAFWGRFETLYEAAKLEHRRLLIPWKYLSKALAVIVAALSVPLLLDAMRSSAAATEVISPAAPTTSAGATLTPLQVAGTWAATAAATSVAVVSVVGSSDEVFNPAGSWVLVDAEVTVDSVATHPELERQVLVIEARGDSFVITEGPSRLLGTAFDARRDRDTEAVARSVATYRGDCVDLETRELIAEGVYSITDQWEFFIEEALLSHPQDLEQFGFRYLETGVKDRHPPEAATCADATMVEITATAIRYDPLD